ncbi:hypothetical protein [Pseudoponticoccus marisrubri]|uniref:Roadblock/LAMTOR2 domain-containing protein n=1 Tax=Pseudoponticoccus marisrubri TaxID=1685382 RepID=A0A0W7WKG0_9RHOB|nr:hypothetical protein [Pseudoponticoccus marisrubri]KUF11090.1 hypothetical protein AVJ23_08510 [Pseudoponticoccus marisrubri]
MAFDTLAALRTEFDSCERVLFVDLSTRTVLAWDGAVKLPQERLDALCHLATATLGIGGIGAGPGCQQAVVAGATGCHILRRVAPGADEALCCTLAPGAAVGAILPRMAQLCETLSGPASRRQA